MMVVLIEVGVNWDFLGRGYFWVGVGEVGVCEGFAY